MMDNDLFILENYVDLPIPHVLKYLSDKDVLDNYLEMEEQLVAEFLVYGEVQYD